MSKCDNCVIMTKMKECNEPCACAWYIDNVVCGEKSIDDCELFEESEGEE